MKKVILKVCVFLLLGYELSWSAEIAVKINPGQSDDGDVLVAINDRRIHAVHAQHICHKDKVGFKPDGYREAGTLLDMMLSKTMQYKYERISTMEIRKTNLKTFEQNIISDKPNARGEYIDVPLYIQRRLKHPKHLIFGTEGNEYWYGGNTDHSEAAINAIWTEIEARTPKRKVDHGKWPFTDTELKNFLIIPMVDMTDAQANEFVSDKVDQDGEFMGKKHYFDYENDARFSAQDKSSIRSKNKPFDIRDRLPFSSLEIKQR